MKNIWKQEMSNEIKYIAICDHCKHTYFFLEAKKKNSVS